MSMVLPIGASDHRSSACASASTAVSNAAAPAVFAESYSARRLRSEYNVFKNSCSAVPAFLGIGSFAPAPSSTVI